MDIDNMLNKMLGKKKKQSQFDNRATWKQPVVRVPIIGNFWKTQPNTQPLPTKIQNRVLPVQRTNAGPAPIRRQSMWANKPTQNKIVDRIIMKDADRDSVPDKYDCQPNNPGRDKTQTYTTNLEKYSGNSKGGLLGTAIFGWNDTGEPKKNQTSQDVKNNFTILLEEHGDDKKGKQKMERDYQLFKQNFAGKKVIYKEKLDGEIQKYEVEISPTGAIKTTFIETIKDKGYVKKPRKPDFWDRKDFTKQEIENYKKEIIGWWTGPQYGTEEQQRRLQEKELKTNKWYLHMLKNQK